MSLGNTATIAYLTLLAFAAPAPANGDRHGQGPVGDVQTSAFRNLVDDYLAIQTALAGDSLDGVYAHAKEIETAARELGAAPDPRVAAVQSADLVDLQAVLPGLARAAGELASAEDIVAARKSFGSLSNAMITCRGPATGDKPSVAYCSMAGMSWLQTGAKIANPYYGQAMLRCGAIVEK